MIAKLQYITQDIEGVSHAQLAEEACAAGVRWVQLRTKSKSFDAWLKEALAVREVCRRYGAVFIVNDNVEIALRTGADGVHLGKDDMKPADARRMLGKGFIIGGSSNTMDEVRGAMYDVDYLGIGPFRFTNTKEKLNPVLGLEGIAAVAMQCRLEKIHVPLIAIGGIVPEDAGALMGTGVHGLAVASAISQAEDKQKIVRNFYKAFTWQEEIIWNH